MLRIGYLKSRYKRFFMEVLVDDEIIVAHCPNPGRMSGLIQEDALVAISHSKDLKRKLPYTVEMIQEGDVWVGCNTMLPNRLVNQLLITHALRALPCYDFIQKEYLYKKGVRFDFALASKEKIHTLIEVKNVHWKRGDTIYFPDSPTSRGQKHLRNLLDALANGFHVRLIYVVQRHDFTSFDIAGDIDPNYQKLHHLLIGKGVKPIILNCYVSPEEGVRFKTVLDL